MIGNFMGQLEEVNQYDNTNRQTLSYPMSGFSLHGSNEKPVQVPDGLIRGPMRGVYPPPDPGWVGFRLHSLLSNCLEAWHRINAPPLFCATKPHCIAEGCTSGLIYALPLGLSLGSCSV